MPITTVLFDLDGTLLPMDLEIFVKDYLSRIAGKLAPHGYDHKKMVDTIWRGTALWFKMTVAKVMKKHFGKLRCPCLDSRS